MAYESGNGFGAVSEAFRLGRIFAGYRSYWRTVGLLRRIEGERRRQVFRRLPQDRTWWSRGSTLSVYPASSLPLMAAQRGIPYVIINRGATNHDGDESVSLRLDGDVAEIPPSVDIALRRKR